MVTRSLVFEGQESLDHCVFDARTYRNPNRVDEQLGRSILAARDALVVIPKHPLSPGSTYRVILTVNSRTIDWSFRVN